MEKDIVITPKKFFRFEQIFSGIVSLSLLLYFWPKEPTKTYLALQIVGAFVFIGFTLFFFTNGLMRRITVAGGVLLNRSGFPLGTQRIQLSSISSYQLKKDETFMVDLQGRGGSSSERTLILFGKQKETLGKINISGFDPSDIKRLLSALKV